jgi:carbonic anhydrase/acetyltransferase-like protein (isoleucine patch superfamily)
VLLKFEGILPKLNEKTFVAEGAKLIGDVQMDEFSSVWFNCVARGDVCNIVIGKYSNVQDNSVLHVADNKPCIIGDYVTVGHNVVLHGCEVEDHCLIGMGATVLTGAKIGHGSIVAAGALVKENQIIPPHSLVAGVPGKIIRTVENQLDNIHSQAVKYKTLWTKRYGLMPEATGEVYLGEKIV